MFGAQQLVECHADPVPPAPDDMAKKLQSFLGEDQCEFIGNSHQVWKIQRGAGGGYVAHGAIQVFGLERVKNRSLHKRGAARGAALFNALKVILHWLTAPELSMAMKPNDET